MQVICEYCENASFCKFYKAYKNNSLKNMFIPEFIKIEIYKKRYVIIDCDKFISILESKNEF